MRTITPRVWIISTLLTITLLSVLFSNYWPAFTYLFYLFFPLTLLALSDIYFSEHTLLRLYPLIGRLRYLFEAIRPEIQQYFVESNINGRPINREFRDLVYQRSKGVRDTRPFGTQFDVYRNGYEWVNHSLAPKEVIEHDPRIIFGGKDCTQPYAASPLNISAMSFGALSKNAILALNKGAKKGGFAHNTGEGGLSPYHQQYGGDLIWQIGTGYFGCRNKDGGFNELLFAEKATQSNVKMIEIKLSQGAKPGHGGILPAIKLTQEIADIRHVPMGQDVVSPPAHTEFSNPIGLLHFVQKLRTLSNGKPVGFKLCIGRKDEFLAICKAMLETNITPDFITIDGGEGGTGAAPIELTNSVGTPLREGLVFVHNALIGCGLRDEIKLIVSGKTFSAFHIFRLLALGADTVNVARSMMLALGCIQSRHCNTDKCPTGIATQDARRYNALDVDKKGERVFRFHQAMIKNLMEFLAAAGLQHLHEIKPHHVNQRTHSSEIQHFGELYQFYEKNFLLDEQTIPSSWLAYWQKAAPTSW
jgi:glutamate synthase domain-containing protein 2